MSPLHRGINISSSSIGSQEVNLEFMCLVEMQSKSMASSHIGDFRSLSRVRLEDAAAQKGQEIAGVIILLKNQEQYLHLKNCLPNISELICVARRQEESRQGRFAGLARLFSLPGKLHILFRAFSPCQAAWARQASCTFQSNILRLFSLPGTPERRAKQYCPLQLVRGCLFGTKT